jgi:dihydrofolate reductase
VVVLSRDPSQEFPYAQRAGNLQDGLDLASSLAPDTWICGGEGIYREAMPLAEELYLTQIDAKYEGDVFFPEWENFFKREISTKEVHTDGLKLTFRVLGK